jgi:tetratricopeptide (TPR) repeat protein
MARGYQAAEVVQTYARAWELCQQIGESPQLVPVLAGLFRYYFGCGELSTAYDLGKQMLRLAQRGSDPFPLLVAHLMLGSVCGVRGEFPAARDHFERGIALSDAQPDHAAVFLYGDDPGTLCLTQAGTVLWYLGYPDQALQKSRQALARAQTLEIPCPRMFLCFPGAWLPRGRSSAESADSLLALSVKHGFQYWTLEGQFLQKVALLLQHQKDEEQFIRDNLPEHKVSASVPGRVRLMGMIAEAYGKMGKAKEGLRIIDEELALMQRDGTCMYEAELHRIKGELLLQMSAEE